MSIYSKIYIIVGNDDVISLLTLTKGNIPYTYFIIVYVLTIKQQHTALYKKKFIAFLSLQITKADYIIQYDIPSDSTVFASKSGLWLSVSRGSAPTKRSFSFL